MADGPRCLVLGGSGALGRVVCETVLAQGGRLALTYHSREAVARELQSRWPGVVALPLDLRSLPAVERVVDEAATALGGLDAFVQCAGVAVTTTRDGRPASHPRMAEIDEAAWDAMLDVNAKSTFFAVRRVVEWMRDGGGNIVLVGSVDGVKPVPAPVHYAASKGTLGGMVAAMAKEVGELRIRVNLVAPGILEDGISKALEDRLMKEYLKHCGMRRLGRLAEIASLVAWLVRHNTYVTGQTILVDGAL
jgi:NAD(P)-dependent dehydrogenase (short-subunit alcohol dehydrogenase family)